MAVLPRDEASSGGDSSLTIQLLGAFRIDVGPRAVAEPDWRLRKAKSLVKLLALAPEHQLHREELLEALWPEMDPDAAANNLHKVVYTARRALEPTLSAATPSQYLHMRGETLALRPPGSLRVDVEEFERAAAEAVRQGGPDAYDAALSIYAGDLLPEDRYEDWAAGRREELRARHLGLLLELAHLQEARNASAAAIASLRRVVTYEPAHEEAHVTLMRLLARTGQRHQALRQYQQLRDALRRELDVNPAPASQRLYQEILEGSLAAAPVGNSGPSARVARQAARPDPGAALVGRDGEIEAIEDLLDAIFAGQGRVLLLAGEAGIGKSSLVSETAERVRRRGGAALLGAAYEQEGRLPYGPFAEALIPLGGLAASPGFRAWLGDDAGDVTRLTPPAVSALRADRQRLFAAIAGELQQHASSTPTLLALEDLHAADDASLQLLHYLVRTSRESSLLILGTFRPEDVAPASALSDLIGALRRESHALRLDLQRLSPRENDLLVAGLLDESPADRAVPETLYRLAAGNPLYTREVLHALREGDQLRRLDGRWRLFGEAAALPRPVLDVLADRLTRLGPAAMQVLTAAAVAGAEVAFPLLRHVSDLPESAMLDALDLCLERHALVESAAGYRFDHPLRRMAVYERLSRARRTGLHGRIATAIEELHATNLADQAESLAHHWALSERPGQAVPHLIVAGNRAAAMHAKEVAIAAYHRALELLNAPGGPADTCQIAAGLWEKVGDLLALAGDAPADAEAYQAALAALEPLPAVELGQMARLHRKAAFAALARHDATAAAPHLAAAEAALGDARDTAEWGRVRLTRAVDLWARGEGEEGRRAAEESLAIARKLGDDLDLYNAYGTLALVFHSSAAWKEGLELEIESAGDASDADPRLAMLFDAHACLGEYYLYSDASFEAVEAYANRILERATRVGARRAEALAWFLRGQALLLSGRWDEAISCLERSLELQRAVGSAPGEALALQRLAEVHARRGEHATAQAHLTKALTIAVDPPMAPHVWVRVYATAALNALWSGDPAAAVRAIEAAAETTERSGTCVVCEALLQPMAADAFLSLGDLARAEEYTEAAERTAAQWERGTWQAMAELSRAGVERARGDAAAAARRFLAATAEFERIGQPFDAARGLLGAGQAVADCGDAAEARTLVSRALQTFEKLGALTAAARTRDVLSLL